MTYIKVNDTLYPATIDGRIADYEWNRRDTKSITLTMTYAEVLALLPDNTPWSIVQKDIIQKYDENGKLLVDSDGNPVTEEIVTEFDDSEQARSGVIRDNRNGTVTIRMGKLTEIESILSELESEVK